MGKKKNFVGMGVETAMIYSSLCLPCLFRTVKLYMQIYKEFHMSYFLFNKDL